MSERSTPETTLRAQIEKLPKQWPVTYRQDDQTGQFIENAREPYVRLSDVLALLAERDAETPNSRKELIDARNGIMQAVVALRGGYSSRMDGCDEAIAELDLAIGKLYLPTPPEPSALRAYVQHKPECSVLLKQHGWIAPNGDAPCTCGLDALLADRPKETT